MFRFVRRLQRTSALLGLAAGALLILPFLANAQSPAETGGIMARFGQPVPESTPVTTPVAQLAPPQIVLPAQLPAPTVAQAIPVPEVGLMDIVDATPAPPISPPATFPMPPMIVHDFDGDAAGDGCDKDGKPKSAWLSNPKTAFIARGGFFPMPPGVLEPIFRWPKRGGD
jgi:hypothetical protein